MIREIAQINRTSPRASAAHLLDKSLALRRRDIPMFIAWQTKIRRGEDKAGDN